MESKTSSATVSELEAALTSLVSVEQDNEHQTPQENTEENDRQFLRKGRPVGSRNRPRENPVVYRARHDAMMPHVLQVEAGADIVDCLQRFFQSLDIKGLYVMSARGLVSDVTVSLVGSVTSFPGIFQILSLSGSYFPTANSLTLVAFREKLIQGIVQGILRAAGPVDIIAASCADPCLLLPRLRSASGDDGDNTGSH